MTRTHVRLLGPCFKTGPEGSQIYRIANQMHAITAPAHIKHTGRDTHKMWLHDF